MARWLRSAAFGAASMVAVLSSPAHALLALIPDPLDFSFSESPGVYTLSNSSSNPFGWYIEGLAVSNPQALIIPPTGTSQSNWNYYGTSFNGTPEYVYLNKNNLSPWSSNLANDVGPGQTGYFYFSAVEASNPTIVVVNGNGNRYFIENGVASVPELSTWAMLIIGFAGVGFLAHRGRARLRLA